MQVYATTRITHVGEIEIRTDKNVQGWSGCARGLTERSFAVFVGGEILRTSTGAVRTFATRESATTAGRKMAERMLADESNGEPMTGAN